jgi:hypothetical protein
VLGKLLMQPTLLAVYLSQVDVFDIVPLQTSPPSSCVCDPPQVSRNCHGDMDHVMGTKWHVRVRKQSCKQGNHLILWASEHTDIFFFDSSQKT